MKRKIAVFVMGCTGLLFSIPVISQPVKPIIVDIDHPKTEIQPTMWGIFFEDINFAADGGIYAEMVMNRSFEFYKPKMGWKVDVTSKDSSHFLILNRGILNEANPRFARISLKNANEGLSIINSGFRSMGIKQNMRYNFSIMASIPGESSIVLKVELISEKGEKIGESIVSPKGKDWKKYEASFHAAKSDLRGSLKIRFEGTGIVDFDMVSLFPGDTWKDRPGGLRADIVQLLAELKPGFVRFPGGCIVEGYDLSNRYQWKRTIGNVENRQLIINRWNTEFKHKPAPDYYQSYGLGFYEYFLLSEDLGAEPLPILNCGMACQFNSAELVPLDQLDPYIQDALDLIEFANGSADTKWGKIRLQMGHPAPFNMKYLGIGNEQWGPQYIERYALFEKVINEIYPEIKLVSGTGPQPDDELFKYAADALKSHKPALVDEHYYRPPKWFRDNATRYDTYDRNSYKIFASEYAAQSVFTTSPDNKNNWECALSEAAFMTGLERNADVVNLCSYAPLLAHVDGWQWTPDLIWFDNLNSFGTANYYVQKLFSNNKGTQVLPMMIDNKPLTGKDGLYASATFDQPTNEIILKIVNLKDKSQPANIVLQSAKKLAPKGRIIILKSEDLNWVNSLNQPTLISPVEQEFTLNEKTFNQELAPFSFIVIRIKTE